MKEFIIEVKAIGYETTRISVLAASAGAVTYEQKRKAFKKFADHNAISMGDARGFGSESIFKS